LTNTYSALWLFRAYIKPHIIRANNTHDGCMGFYRAVLATNVLLFC